MHRSRRQLLGTYTVASINIYSITDFYRGIMVESRGYTLHCCEGLAMDLLQTLSNELDFDYQLYLSPDGSFGALDAETGNWTGMVKELLDGTKSVKFAHVHFIKLQIANVYNSLLHLPQLLVEIF